MRMDGQQLLRSQYIKACIVVHEKIANVALLCTWLQCSCISSMLAIFVLSFLIAHTMNTRSIVQNGESDLVPSSQCFLQNLAVISAARALNSGTLAIC